MTSRRYLGLTARNWNFLRNAERYVKASQAEATNRDLPLALETTRRQFDTARDILARLNGRKPIKGVLLADDVGLGKTTVAALVAWVFASAKKNQTEERCRVRILAPNVMMQRTWAKELRRHVQPLQRRGLDVDESRLKIGGKKLREGRIQVVKHSNVRVSVSVPCDLLIIDEAHRAKGENSEFRYKLEGWVKKANRVLILTATPFSINIRELNHMLELIGANKSAADAVTAFDNALRRLHSGTNLGETKTEAKDLAKKARTAVEHLSHFAIRHGVDDLVDEQKWFGKCQEWPIKVEEAASDEMEMLLRMDRALRLAKCEDLTSKNNRTNDARFHVARQHFRTELQNLSNAHGNSGSAHSQVIMRYTGQIQDILKRVPIDHPKMASVGAEVIKIVNSREKVVLFCDHHATAQELTVFLDKVLPKFVVPVSPDSSEWKAAWIEVFQSEATNLEHHTEKLLDTFIEWLCSDLIRAQVRDWNDNELRTSQLIGDIRRIKARHSKCPVKTAEAAIRLYHAILKNPSSRAVLRWVARQPSLMKSLQRIPGANGTSRVLGICKEIVGDPRFLHSGQPDLALEIFNSPFGPDVLVTTDILSEGIDLHRYCRHLIHYELDPSPIRTVQRNGRIRRVNSWAAITGQKILYAYPAFIGTRDQRLVNIMRKRIDNFSLLLGGVPPINLDEDTDSDEKWRNEVIREAKKRLGLEFVSKMLVAKERSDDD